MMIRRIDPVSSAKVFGAFNALIGVIVGIFWAFFASIIARMPELVPDMEGATGGQAFNGMIGISAIIIFPFLYGFFGIIGGLIGAAIYNLISRFVGGLEVEME